MNKLSLDWAGVMKKDFGLPQDDTKAAEWYKEVLTTLDKAIEIYPDDSMSWFKKGFVLNKLDSKEEAIKAYDKVLEINPVDSKAWSNKGAVLYELNRKQEALYAYDQAVELQPDNSSAWYNKACLFASEKDKENAIRCLKKSIEIEIGNKQLARTEKDFLYFMDDLDFQNLINN
jgi:tetratricopeptide (TPR) repeat protein